MATNAERRAAQREIHDKRLAQIRERAGKMNVWQIAYETGLDPKNVAYIAHKNGVSLACMSTRQARKKKEQELLRLFREGLTVKQIAGQLGIAERTVASDIYILRQQGLDIPHRSKGGHRNGFAWQEEHHHILIERWCSGVPAEDIAREISPDLNAACVQACVDRLRRAGHEIPFRHKGRVLVSKDKNKG